MSDELEEVRVRAGRVRGFGFADDRDDDRPGRERRRDERARRLLEREDRPPARVPPPAAPLPEVVIASRPGPIPGAVDPFGNQIFQIGNFRGTRGEFERELGPEGVERLRAVGAQLEGEENARYQKFLAECGGDQDCAKLKMRRFLKVNGYSNSTIREVFQRLDSLFGRAVQAVTDVLPEVVVRSRAARVLTGTPLGLAGALVEGALRTGQELSRRALDRAVRRIAPPPVAPFPPVGALPPPPGRPQDVLPVPPLEVVTITAPRDRPVSFDQVFPGQRFATLPRTGTRPGTRTRTPTTPTRLQLPGPAGFTGAIPGGLTGDRSRPVPSRQPQPSARPAPAPVALAGCPPCSPDKGQRKRKKRKPRTVCYTGTYRDLRNGLTKRKRERIPCE